MRKYLMMFGGALCIAMALSGCTAIKQDIRDNVTYRIESVEVEVGIREGQGLLPTFAADVTLNVRVLNESRVRLTLTQVDYQVFANDSKIADGSMGESITIEANGGEDIVQLFAQLSGRALLNEGIGLTRSRALPPIRVIGVGHITTRFGQHEVPFTLHYNNRDEGI